MDEAETPNRLNIETEGQRESYLSMFSILEQSSGWQILKKEFIALAKDLERDILDVTHYDLESNQYEDLNEKRYSKLDLLKIRRHYLLMLANFPQAFIDEERQKKRENPSAIELDPFLDRGSHQISPEDIEGEMPL